MALDDIVFPDGCPQNFILEVGAVTMGTPVDILYDLGVCQEELSVWPDDGDVDNGVTYGPTGNLTGALAQPTVTDVKKDVQYGAHGTEFTGTYDPGGGPTPAPAPRARFGGGLG